MGREFIRELRCKKCGKIFCPAPQHMYKDHKGMYCSWTCYNHRDDCQDKKRAVRVIEQYTKDGVLLNVFPTLRKAADHINGYAQSISVAANYGKAYKGYVWKYREEADNG